MVAGMNNLSTLLHPSALGNLVIFPLGLELAYHLTSFNYCLQSCSQFSTGQVPTAISRPSAIGLVGSATDRNIIDYVDDEKGSQVFGRKARRIEKKI